MRRDKTTSQTVSTVSPSGPPHVLFEDNHLLAIYKPAGWQTQPSDSPSPDAMTWSKAYLKEKYAKPGNVFLGLVHRLDRPVSGVLLFARTSKGASRLSEEFRSRRVEKIYRAWVEGKVAPGRRHIQGYLTPKAEPKVEVYEEPGTNRLRAEMSMELVEQLPDRALVEIALGTGRKHQIRALLAHLGNPILGDLLYGREGSERPASIALMAHRLVFAHPTQGTRVQVVVEGREWMDQWRRFPL